MNDSIPPDTERDAPKTGGRASRYDRELVLDAIPPESFEVTERRTRSGAKQTKSMWPKGPSWTPANITKAIVAVLGAISLFIAGTFGGVKGLIELVKAAKDTSAEFALLRTEIETAREEFRASKKKIDGLDEWRENVDIRANKQTKQIESVAKLGIKLNGRAPSDGWPEIAENEFNQPPQPRKALGDYRSTRTFEGEKVREP